ncbi:hypothetical protein LY90DRAFT_513926 [Neocallimastix californiae]|uniref:Uncharacterized protein n=1 Tax=Neocallimastix californiae TaxID=1754190 RepID=A0A1Y2ATU7_9FUNG|nr:hypothetical protein LY90DRAFT_513926 [Neocallimastix californiae]|eukprot:ORY25969.1 hypothetical protein LY90DRAFT_513926 [Neocallimastix californiae]
MNTNNTNETVIELLINSENESTSNRKNQNVLFLIASRFSFIVIILRLIRYKNLNFLFPLTAALFTFSNNTNDAWNYIYHVENCSPFYYILKITDTLNWAPMSWLQVYRLVIISNINLPKRITSPIITLAILLNLTYYFCYFNNLNNYKKIEIMMDVLFLTPHYGSKEL